MNTQPQPERRVSKAALKEMAVKPPKSLTTNGLCYRFQVFYREVAMVAQLRVVNAPDLVPVPQLGPVQSIWVTAETQGEARWVLEQDKQLQVTSVGVGIPEALDPERQIFDRESAAVFCGVETSLIDTWMANGTLPHAPKNSGFPRFTRAQLVKASTVHMEGGNL